MPNPAGGAASPADNDDAVARRVERLTSAQLDCLRLVNEHLSSKEIAVRLGISPHTVDQRIRGALHTLGVERRSQAARLVARHNGYQRLIHQSPHIEAPAPIGEQGGAVSNQIRHAGRAGEVQGGPGFLTEQRPEQSWPSLQLPFATRNHPRNEMSVGIRLLWIAGIATGGAFSAGVYLAGLESLARLLGSH